MKNDKNQTISLRLFKYKKMLDKLYPPTEDKNHYSIIITNIINEALKEKCDKNNIPYILEKRSYSSSGRRSLKYLPKEDFEEEVKILNYRKSKAIVIEDRNEFELDAARRKKRLKDIAIAAARQKENEETKS